jgi:hypothetical protein
VKTIKSLIAKAYVLCLMAFTVWYGYFMFPLIFGFEGKEQAAKSLLEMGHAGAVDEAIFGRLIAEQTRVKKTDLGFRVIEQPYVEGRFHHIGFSIQKDNASICVRCHGNVPHDESKEIRSFLNMHTFYLACETCHMVPEAGAPPWQFRWYNKDDGTLAANPRALVEIDDLYHRAEHQRKYPAYGNYGATIAPGAEEYGAFRFLHGEKDKSFVERYLAEREQLAANQKSQMKRVIHRGVTKDPLQCKDCHNKTDPYLPFAELGFPPRRVEELTTTAVVGMIDKYNKFYLPHLLKPGISKE